MARQPVIKKPVVPEDTCPYIDMLQDLIDKMTESEDAEHRNDQAVLARALLEYIRESNTRLRASSKYWYGRYKP
jgi:hypothetical protein